MNPIDFDKLQATVDIVKEQPLINNIKVLLELPMQNIPMEYWLDYKEVKEPHVEVRFDFGNPFGTIEERNSLKPIIIWYRSIQEFIKTFEATLSPYIRPLGDNNYLTKFFNETKFEDE
jgi:hypothetical protein